MLSGRLAKAVATKIIQTKTGRATSRATNGETTAKTTVVVEVKEAIVEDVEEVGLPTRRPLIDCRTAEAIEEEGTMIAAGEMTIAGTDVVDVEVEEEETAAEMVAVGVVDSEAEENVVTVPREIEGRETNTNTKNREQTKTLCP